MIFDISGSISSDYEDVTVFWDVMRRRVVWELTQTFQRHLPPSSLVEAVVCSEVSVHIYHSTRRHMAEEGCLYESEFTLCFQFVRCSVDPPCCVVLLS
jgi:hypothetical protein